VSSATRRWETRSGGRPEEVAKPAAGAAVTSVTAIGEEAWGLEDWECQGWALERDDGWWRDWARAAAAAVAGRRRPSGGGYAGLTLVPGGDQVPHDLHDAREVPEAVAGDVVGDPQRGGGGGLGRCGRRRRRRGGGHRRGRVPAARQGRRRARSGRGGANWARGGAGCGEIQASCESTTRKRRSLNWTFRRQRASLRIRCAPESRPRPPHPAPRPRVRPDHLPARG
jgi:hypothetical protein